MMRYDAFISYRHGELDGVIAERLHRMLETYRIPRQITKKTGKKKINRVFRDKEELPISADLSDSIEDALQESEFLILICSKRTCQSRWVMREVERFIELGRQDRIITLLIDGEPEESFPEQIRWREHQGRREEVEPLAADIRAQNAQQSLKLLKKGEFLRLAASILECKYDDLRQRHRERTIRRAAAAGAGVLAVSAAFGAVTFSQLLQINAQMQKKLYNQSHVLAEYSDKVLQSGDPVTAALLALEALPQNLENPERPYVQAAEMVLANAIGVYDYRATYLPHRSLNLEADIDAVSLNAGESYAAFTLKNNRIAVVSTATAQLLRTLRTPPIAGRRAAFLSESTLVYTDTVLTAVHIDTGEVLWEGDPTFGFTVSSDRSTVASFGSTYAAIRSSDGTLRQQIDFGGRTVFVDRYDLGQDQLPNTVNNCVELNEDGSLLAVNFVNDTFSVFDTVTGEETALLTDASVAACAFTKDYLVCAWAFTGSAGADSYYVTVFQRGGWETVWETDTGGSPASCATLEERIFYSHQTDLWEFAPASGTDYYHITLPYPIAQLQANGSYLLIGCDYGRFALLDLHSYSLQAYSNESSAAASYTALVLGDTHAIAATSRFGSARILRMNDKQPLAAFSLRGALDSAHGSAAGDRIAIVEENGFRLYDAQSAEQTAAITFPAEQLAGRPMVMRPYEDIQISRVQPGDSEASMLFYTFYSGEPYYSTQQPYVTTEAGLNIQEGGQIVLIAHGTGEELARYEKTSADSVALAIGPWVLHLDGATLQLRAHNTESGEVNDVGVIDRLHSAWNTDLGAVILFSRNSRLEVYSLLEGTSLFSVDAENWQDILLAVYSRELHAIRVSSRTELVKYYSFPEGELMDINREAGGHLQERSLGDGAYLVTKHIHTGQMYYEGYLRDSKTLEPVARIPCYEDVAGNTLLIRDDYAREFKMIPIYSTEALLEMGRAFVAGYELTLQQREQYHIAE